MAILRNMANRRDVLMAARNLIGRSNRADVQLTGMKASTVHALIQWDGTAWSIRDLHSTNGTRVNETLIGPEWRLVAGDRIVFGDPDECWSWVDGTPPRATATRDDGLVVQAPSDVLYLPDESDRQVSIFVNDGRWELESSSATTEVENGQMIEVAARRFHLELPPVDPVSTQTQAATPRSIGAARITFRPSLSEEDVPIVLQCGDKVLDVPTRSFHYMLLILARVRATEERSGIQPGEAGWLYTDELAAMLNASIEHINVDVHRIRTIVDRMGIFDDPRSIIERRRGGLLRLGIRDIVIEGAEPPASGGGGSW